MPENDKSILITTKRTLGLAEDYTAFDEEVMLHINSVFGDLNQLGLGPDLGFEISDATALWSDFLGDDLLLSAVKSYMYLRVRLLFDSSSLTGPVLGHMEKQIEKLEWRLNVVREYALNGEPEI